MSHNVLNREDKPSMAHNRKRKQRRIGRAEGETEMIAFKVVQNGPHPVFDGAERETGRFQYLKQV